MDAAAPGAWNVCPCDDRTHRHFKGSAPAPALSWHDPRAPTPPACGRPVFATEECPVCLAPPVAAARALRPRGVRAVPRARARTRVDRRVDGCIRCPLCRAPFALEGRRTLRRTGRSSAAPAVARDGERPLVGAARHARFRTRSRPPPGPRPRGPAPPQPAPPTRQRPVRGPPTPRAPGRARPGPLTRHIPPAAALAATVTFKRAVHYSGSESCRRGPGGDVGGGTEILPGHKYTQQPVSISRRAALRPPRARRPRGRRRVRWRRRLPARRRSRRGART